MHGCVLCMRARPRSKSNYSMRANGGSGYGGPMRGANGGGGSTYSSRAPAAVPLPPTAAAAGAGAVLAPVQLPATTPSSAAAARDVDGSSSVVSSGNSASAVQNGSELQMAVKVRHAPPPFLRMYMYACMHAFVRPQVQAGTLLHPNGPSPAAACLCVPLDRQRRDRRVRPPCLTRMHRPPPSPLLPL